MEHTNETEKQTCPRCGTVKYDEETGTCPDCGFGTDEDETFIPKVKQNLYLDGYICPVCGKNELLMEGDVCKVCGKQICPACRRTGYDVENDICPHCKFRANASAEEMVEQGLGQYLYWDRCICPVCGKTVLLMEGDVCQVCKWFNDPLQNENPNYDYGQNKMSLNQAREAYSKGLPIE